MAGAMHAQLPEIWLAPQPILLFVYLRQYLPSAYFWLSPRVGATRVAAFRKGSTGYDSITSNPFGALLGGAPTAGVPAVPAAANGAADGRSSKHE